MTPRSKIYLQIVDTHSTLIAGVQPINPGFEQAEVRTGNLLGPRYSSGAHSDAKLFFGKRSKTLLLNTGQVAVEFMSAKLCSHLQGAYELLVAYFVRSFY